MAKDRERNLQEPLNGSIFPSSLSFLTIQIIYIIYNIKFLFFQSMMISLEGKIFTLYNISSIKKLINQISEDTMNLSGRGNINKKYDKELILDLIEDIPEAMLLYSLDGKIIWANREACNQLGYTKEEFRKLTLNIPKDKQTVEEAIENKDRSCLLYTSPSPRD